MYDSRWESIWATVMASRTKGTFCPGWMFITARCCLSPHVAIYHRTLLGAMDKSAHLGTARRPDRILARLGICYCDGH